MIIEDGSLPSNVGGGANVRNILRRVFALLKKNNWWEKIGMDGLIDLFLMHKEDLREIYGEFKEYKSFRSIIEVEYDRWIKTDQEQRVKLEKILKKNNGKLKIDDWILAMTSWGIPADAIAQISGLEPPGNLYYEIAYRNETSAKAPEVILYSTSHLPETENLYYVNHYLQHGHSKVVEIFPNITQNNIANILILDGSAFYPTSGGQQHDIGKLMLNGEEYNVVDVEKVGHCVLHILDRAITGDVNDLRGTDVEWWIDFDRRDQLRRHHTGTHIMYAATRKVLGPHVWQNGAKKTVEQAHLDITHYRSLSHEEEVAIENEANRIISNCVKINKFFMNKSEAEQQYGFNLYQGGIVPGNSLRVVNIEGVDTEACCGTHCDNTSEVGWLRLLKSHRVSDGIVRLYYVAGEKAIQRLNEEDKVIHSLNTLWSISINEIVPTAERFFNDYKKLDSKAKKQELKLLELTLRCIASDPNYRLALVESDQKSPTLYFSYLKTYAQLLKNESKGIIFTSDNFVYGLLGNPQLLDIPALQELLKNTKGEKAKLAIKTTVQDSKNKKAPPVDGVIEFSYVGEVPAQVTEFLTLQGGRKFE